MGWIKFNCNIFCNYFFTINVIIGCMFCNFWFIGLTSFLIPNLCTTKFESNPNISVYDHTNTFYFYLRIDTNIYFYYSFNDFPNWIISRLLGSSFKFISIISSINIWDPYSNWPCTGIQFLSSRLYSSSSSIFCSIKFVFIIGWNIYNIIFISSNYCIVVFYKWVNSLQYIHQPKTLI